MKEGDEKLPVFCAIRRRRAMDTKPYGVTSRKTSREIRFTAKETHWTRKAGRWDRHFQPIFVWPSERRYREVTTSVCVHHFNRKFSDFFAELGQSIFHYRTQPQTLYEVNIPSKTRPHPSSLKFFRLKYVFLILLCALHALPIVFPFIWLS
jgi:hypothetical protein